MSQTLILDNGSFNIKAGYSKTNEPELVPNYVFKSTTDYYVGSEVDQASDPAGLYRQSPFEKGYPVHMNIEDKVWQSIFHSKEINLNAADTKLVLTDPNYTLPALEVFSRELLFETYGFHSLLVTSAPTLMGRRNFIETGNNFCLVVDSGHSFSHVVPFLGGKNIVEATIRVDVGGMTLTNFLRKHLTNQVDLMNEFSIVNDVKQDCCYFADNLDQELKLFETGKKSAITYYLPDYSLLSHGKIQSETDPKSFSQLSSVRLAETRAITPELLFRPSLAGINQTGLSDAIKKTCNRRLPYYCIGENMLKNIVCFGGTCLLPGFKNKLCHELSNVFELSEGQSAIKDCVHVASDPVLAPFNAATYLLENDPGFNECFVTRQEFAEHGIRIFDKKYTLSAPREWYNAVRVDNEPITVIDL